MKYTCVDSFCGAGGLSLGLERAGFEVLLSFDLEEKCVDTMLANPQYFQHECRVADIHATLSPSFRWNTDIKRGELFLLAGGPPCQGFSVQRIGEDTDDRNNLVLLFMELVGNIQPLFFLMENVPGISGKRGKALLGKATQYAEQNGYFVHTKALDAQDYGVPQRRKRVFMVGERADTGYSTFKFPLPTTLAGDRVTVRETIGHIPPPPEDGSDHPDITGHRRDRLSTINLRRLAALSPGQGMEHLPEELLAECHKRGADEIGHRNVYGRMEWDDVAPTITARFDSFTRGKFGHPEQLRSISLHEGALLQTFPSDFRFVGSKVEIARQIGNAVPPKMAEILGRAVLLAHSDKMTGTKR